MSSTSFNVIDPPFLFYRLTPSDCLSWQKQQMSCSHSHVDHLLFVSFPRSQCRLIWIYTCIFMSLLVSVPCTTSTLPYLTNAIVHYRLWPNQSTALPCLNYYIIPSTVFNESYHTIYCLSTATVLWKFVFLPESQNWWHFRFLDCCCVYCWYQHCNEAS